MTADPLRVALQKKYSNRHLDRLVSAKANQEALTRRVAMLAVARDLGMNWTKFASPEEIASVRGITATGTSAAQVTVKVPVEARGRKDSRRGVAPKAAGPPRGPRDRIFIVHGRNEKIRRGMATFLRAVHLDPIEWGQALKATGKPMPHIAETLEAALREVAAVVVLITPDEVAQLKKQFVLKDDNDEEKKPMGQARPNVLFEGGMAYARHPEKTIFVTFGKVKSFSDIGGLHVVRMSGSARKRTELVEKLKTAGAEPQTEGKSDWLSDGDLDLQEEDDADNQAP